MIFFSRLLALKLLLVASVMKQAVRKSMKQKLKFLSIEDIANQSEAICEALIGHPAVQASSGVCIYLSMPHGEVSTKLIISKLFEIGKKVFVPKIVGKDSVDMIVLPLLSLESIDSFPVDKWGISEPPPDYAELYGDATQSGYIDTVIVPGVAFDSSCARMGHGKGYYGG